ncbi:auxin efflux carrier component 5-like [Phoenix dactylifera]|uniref:Auxin efflux carrier component n=1 Tax=Phoenix dactylifera TaxID=42345 RepID=A0A8B7CMD7_PHODC|nr:auxin efflux carrier component 5-like [Phoenix dactylifera]XP_038985872.1 auxin efflux carrier component 5-like [Phoenix dactylifera]
MIGWADIYKVVVAMVPLYVALGLGYGSVRWWRIFTPEQCEAINRLVVYFSLPFFTFEFTVHTDPFAMNYRVIAADAISKVLTVLVLAAWAKWSSKGSYGWSITSFSLSALTNTLVVGAPLLNAMYGRWAQDLVVQLSVVQGIVWMTFLLFMLELRKAGILVTTVAATSNGGGDVVSVELQPEAKDVEENAEVASRPSFCSLMMTVWLKLALNPNFYASVLGVAWAFISNRWHFEMPSIIEGSVLIMSRSGAGLAMFSMGLFMALQEKIIACGLNLTAFGMVLRFVAGPAAMAIGAIAVGLRGDFLRVAIIVAALPQSISSFIFAREYGLHAEVLSTAVIFGTLVSLPLLVACYFALGFIN